MRKLALLAAATAAALIAALFVGSSANADGSTVITAGPNQYSAGFEHPTGTISVGGGTTSARCTATAFKGSNVTGTPKCVTKQISCPVTAPSCTIVWTAQENALRGPVAFGAGLLITGGVNGAAVLSPYSCPKPYSCSLKYAINVTPGSTLQAGVVNLTTPNYPSVFTQIQLTTP